VPGADGLAAEEALTQARVEPRQAPAPARSAPEILLKREAPVPRLLAAANIAVADRDLHDRVDRDPSVCHVWAAVAGQRHAQVRFWEHLQEPCSLQVAWNGSKSNDFCGLD
jgi:hypothetical protein